MVLGVPVDVVHLTAVEAQRTVVSGGPHFGLRLAPLRRFPVGLQGLRRPRVCDARHGCTRRTSNRERRI